MELGSWNLLLRLLIRREVAAAGEDLGALQVRPGDADLDLPPGLALWDLLEKIEPHVLGMNRLVGTYER